MVRPDIDEQVDPSGNIILHEKTTERLQLVADILAKSLVLSHYETRIADIFDRIEPLAATLREKGRAGASGKELLRHIGDVLLIQQKMVGRVETGEKPELLWEHPELERHYMRLADEYELRDRDRALDRKLDVVCRTVETLLGLVQTRSSLRVEWYIVLLIIAELLLTTYPLVLHHRSIAVAEEPSARTSPEDTMPELPDVELFKRHLDATCLGQSIRRVIIGDTRILAGVSASELAQRLEGARITESLRHGKHLLVHLGPPGWLTVHFGMNGSLRHFEDGEDDPPYDRLCLDFADGHHLAYVNPRLLGRVGLARDAAEFIAAERLGPDALNPRFDLAAFERALAGRKRNLKSVLMDQEVVAGIGNVYSDEILFQARLHPRTRSDWLDAATRQRPFRQIKEVLETAIAHGAGTERLIDRLPSSFLIPHRQKGGRCPRCGSEITTAKFSGRTAYYCPRCQPQIA